MIQFSIIIPFKFLTSNSPHALFDVFQMVGKKKPNRSSFFRFTCDFFECPRERMSFFNFRSHCEKQIKNKLFGILFTQFCRWKNKWGNRESEDEEISLIILFNVSYYKNVFLFQGQGVAASTKHSLTKKKRELSSIQCVPETWIRRKNTKKIQRASFNRRLSSCEDFKFG